MRKLNNTAIPRDWLVAEYLLDWNANDTAWSNNWTATNVTWVWTERWYISNCASFNGSSSYIDLWNKMTDAYYWISVWANITDNWNWRRFVDFWESSWSYWQFVISKYQDTNKIMYRNWKNNYQSAAGYLIYNERHHYVIYQKGNTIYFYRDWILHSTTNTSETPQSHSRSYAYIWKSNWSADPLYKWQMVLLRTYNRPLSNSEIQSLYKEGLRKLWPTNLLPSPNTKVRDWLVWEWNLDNNALDTSWNWNDWTPTNVTYNPVWGWGVGSFNGSSSYVDLPNWILWWNTVSISVWAKYSSVSNGYDWKIVDLRNSDWHSVLIRANVKNNVDKFGFYTNFWTDVQSSSTPLDNEYHHFVLIVKNWDISFYNNNELVDSQSWTWTDSWNNEDWKIWQERNDWVNRHFWWQIWLTRIYNRALSQQEINQLHQEWLKYINWNKYSLPPLEQGKVLEISKPQSWWVYYDQSWNWNNWTATNVTDSTVWLNNAMSFNGSSNISIPYATDIAWSDNMTIAISIKPQSTSYQMIYVKTRDSASNTYSLGFWTDWWKIDFSIRDSTESYPAPWLMSTNTVFWIWKWLRVVWRVTNKKVEIFVNWKLQSTYNYSNAWLWDTVTNPINWTNNTEWGVLWKNGVSWYPFYFTWDMKWFKYYNRSLSDTEIQQDFHSTYIN